MSDPLDRISKLSPKRLALLAMDLQSKLDAVERQRTEPIAIIGLGCRVPGADDPEAFWRLLRDGVDAVREVPADRWDVDAHYDPDPDAPGRMSTRWGGFLEHVDRFDPRFFGIAPRDAVSMDPQHRLILEVAWEALEDAGQSPLRLSGSRTGVFVGITASDYARRLGQADLEYLDNYILTGTSLNFVAGRVSYVLGLQGPSMAVDTACSSSLVAVHLACQSLRSGETRMALAGGVNAILTPHGTIATSKARMLARDGRCKTFDAAADGIVRGEGCGVVVLKRLSDALAEGDRVLALVRGSAVNQDGASGGLTVPNGLAQQSLLREALARSGVKPAEVDYVEAHGTGTGLGDPIEVRALAAVLGLGRDPDRPLKIGSVKTNLGHLEPASGVVGLIKTVLALQHQEIPPHLHLKNPTPHVDWKSVPVVVPTVRTPWPANGGRRIAGVSSFGFSGTNAHVVLEEAPVVEERPGGVERPRHVLTVSAKTEGALRELVDRLSRHLPEHPSLGLADVCFTANAGRGHFAHRLAVQAESKEELSRRLSEWRAGSESEGVVHAHVPGSERPKVAFLFTGQGSQHAGMGRGLYETQPTFRKALEQCEEILGGHLARPLLSAMYPGAGDEGLLEETAYTQPALFALEYALAELWRSWGIEPSWVMGHSVGEYAAACVAGVFSLEDGLRLVAERGRLMQALPGRGAMAAVFAGEERVAQALASQRGAVSIAALNGPESVVISGAAEGVGSVREALEAQGVRTRPLDVSHAFHSALMDPVREDFSRAVGSIVRSMPRLGLVSNVTGRPAGAEVTEADYWCRHLREPVRFMEGMETLREQGCAAFIEIGPLPTLLGMGQRCLPEVDRRWLPSLRRGRDDWSQILESLGSLYVCGADVDWAGFDRDYPRRKVALPTYPFQRERYWVEEPQPRPAEKAPARARLEDLVYEVKWPERPRGKAVGQGGVGRWLVLADEGGVGSDLARRLEEGGESCELLYAGSGSGGGRGVEPGEVKEAVQYLIKDGPLRGVVHLWGLEPGETGVSSLQSLEEVGVGSLVSVVQAVSGSGGKGTRLWVVTRGAQAVEESVSSVSGAALWGLGRVIALEHPEMWGGLVDLDPSGSVDANGLLQELCDPDGEDQVALRGGKRHVARLERSLELGEEVRLSGEGSYLITGGLGGLGLGLARWMVGRGARRLYLVGRSEAGEGAREAIGELEGLGARVEVLTGDVSDVERMRWVIGEAGREAALKGIVHAAGVMEACAVVEMGLDEVRAVFRPKVLGGWVLHELSEGLGLDFFVTYSSAAGIWGSQGAGHYAAANHFLDGLVSYRRGKGLPGLSVSWGPWGGGGMATEESQRWLGQMGVGVLSPEQGVEALGRLLGTGVVQGTVAAMDWGVFRPVYEARANRRLLEHIEVSAAKRLPRDEPSTSERSALRRQLAASDSAHRREHLVAYLRRHVARVLGVSTPELVEAERPLSELGLDSLMATQLKNRVEADLEVDVPVANFLAGPSIAELAQLIEEVRSAGSALGAALLRPVSRDTELPLSFGQQRLWFLDQMEAGSAYNLSWVARLVGPLDTAALEASLAEVVRRHEALRTVFPAVEGRPTQVVQPRLGIQLSRVDLGGHPEVDRVVAASRWATDEAQRPFHLARGPLLRASLLHLGEDDHALVLTLHHIVTDGWSMEVLVRELTVLYDAFTRGAPSPLPELPIQYADFAHWQREWLQGKVLEDQLSHWRRSLGSGLPVLELPTDRPRPALRTYRGATHALVFPTALAGELHSLSQREGVTLFMTLVAALQVLLHRYAGQDEVVIGFSVANRNRAELEGLIGFFVNNLVLRTDLSGDPRFRELLARVKDVALDAYAHQDLPFEKLVEELHPERDLAQNPIFQVMLDVQNAARKELRLSGLTLTPIETETRAARFDLEIHLWEGAEQLAVVFHYNTDLFDAATIERMTRHYQGLLQSAVEDPDRRLSELPLLTQGELRQALVEWNATGREYPLDRGLADLVEAQVERTPEAVAVVFEGEAITYRELNRRANRLANHLGALGVGPEVRVGICVERSLEMVVGLLGILKAGGAYVPLDPTYPEDRLAFMLADAEVPVLLTQERLLASLPPHQARVILLDADRDVFAQSPDVNPGVGVSPGSLAYVIYTSGSTGRPKGAMNTHSGICNRLLWMQEEYGLTASDRILQKTPFSFDVSVWEFFWPLMAGARLVVAKPGGHQDPAYLARLIEAEGITTVHFVPSMLRAFLEEPAGSDLTSLRRVICSGEALPYDLQERFFARLEVPLHNLYGPTEAAVDVTRWACRREGGRPVVPIGRPIANTQAYVLDEWMRPVPIGVIAELYLGGVQVGRGYLNRPDLTAEKFVPHPFSEEPGARLYRTGDLVRHLSDGNIEFLGRVDHQVKVRGFRIELGEIESVLVQHPGVKDAVLLAREDHPGARRLVAYVVPVPGREIPAGQLRQHAQDKLPPYMVPSSFVVLQELPLSPNGKVDRRRLPPPEDVGVERETAFAPARTPVEEGVAEIWAQVLRVERVGVHDSFFALGGHSLLVTQLVSRLRKTFGVELPLRAVFQTPTVAELSARIEASRRGTSMPPLGPVSRDGELTQSFAQQRLWFLEQLQPGSSAYNVSTSLWLDGQLNKEALGRSLDAIVDRHESLRTTFATVNGRPVQVVAPVMNVPLVEVDLRGLPDGEQQARRLAEEEALRPFDLSRGPLLRATLLRVAEQEHALLLTVHHIVFDAWSMGIFAREQALLYGAFVSGAPSPLRALDVQYPDFAAWQRDWLQGDVLESQLGYWRERLEGLQALEMPTDHARPAVQTFNGGWRHRTLPVLEDVRQLGQREGATLFMTLLAAFQALLHRYTGMNDVAVGSPIANRPRVELEQMIGLFVNSLVLRTDVSGDPTFRELLARVKEVALGAYDHQDVPFERLVEEVGGQRDLARNPLFQVMFTLHGRPEPVVELPGLKTRPLDKETTTTHADLELHLYETAGDLVAGAVYNRDLFEAATIDRMLGHFQVLLEGIVARPDARLSALPFLAQAERQRTLVEWNRTGRHYPREAGIHELFEVQAARRPEAIAVSFGEEELSYGELNARGNRLAHHLRRHGVGLEVRVGICMERSVEMVVGLLGILKAGGAYVPLDPSYPKERLAFMLEDSRVPVLLTQERMLDVLPEHGARVVCLDQDWGKIAAESDANLASGAGGQSLAYVIYTSGSTGIPKGAAVPHCAVNRLVVNTDYVHVQPSDRVAQASNASFDAATFEIWGALLSGARLVGIRREVTLSPSDLAAELRRSEVTILFLTTALFNQVAREEAAAFSGLRHLLFGGEAVDPAWVREVLRRGCPGRLLHVYGPTETTTFATWRLVEGASTVPIGRPIANTSTYVLDRNLDPVPVGVPGELFIGGDGLARGYLGRPELTAEKFVPDPFSAEGGGRLYRTGDLVRHRPDGAIEFVGRVDHQVKLRGYRIELGEIESVLGQHPGVKDAVVVAREDRPGDKRLVAYVTPRDRHGLEVGELRGHLQTRLPEHMVPSAYVALERLPLSPNGKVDRRALPAPEGPGRPDQAPVPPRNDLEREIAAIWREVLGVDEVGVDENFFDLGGHSLTLLQVHGKLRKGVTHTDVRVVDLFEYPTVSALATYLSKAETGDSNLPRPAHKESRTEVGEEGIAIIGMAGRFPGARDLDQFWLNLRDGVESISFFSAEELEAEGIPAALCREARYVKARGVIEGAELFDAAFFGYNPREAEIMDPQQRVFLETAWTGLERAGYDVGRYRGKIGVYAGTSLNTYVFNLISNPEVVRSAGGLAALIASDKDFLTTRVSYKLNLRGPSVAVQTACSTSLVAVHLACRSLMNHECDIGVAGGVSVGVPQKAGYLYEEEGILSPDGHCRAFDHGARGTVGGSGVGIVVLKRLSDALADGDAIEAVIKGSAINNDGAAKVGYTAPGVEGQAEVIASALAAAGMEPETIGYVEAHGTGTALGDPIEIQALTRVFGPASDGRTPCLIGSLKTNVGHLDAAAGVAGLIKTALALKHRQIPPSLHFEEPNPKIDFANGPFRVSTRLSEWPAQATPRRAAVSSFGIGGTNAHVVLEEAPPPRPAEPVGRPWQLLVLSARTPSALDQATGNLATHFAQHSELDLSDAAYTLQVGRHAFRHRRIAVARDLEDARSAIEAREPGRVLDGHVDRTGNRVAFLFPGQGTQHVDMGRGLYQSEESFRTEIDRCAEVLRPDLGFDLREVLYPAEGREAEASLRLDETALAQPALFVFEYALARLWMAWGVRPEALLGHSIGEYVAACLAGVFSLEDALSLVAARGRLMQEVPKGSMLAVALPEQDVQSLLDGSLGLAATNGPSQCVVSGPREALEALEVRLSARGVDCHRLRTSHAFHSPMMEPVLSEFRERVAAVKRQAPRIRYLSNLTGAWATAEQAVDPGYWTRHLRETVRFSQGLGELLKDGRVLLEVGPGRSLCTLAQQHPERGPQQEAIASARHSRESRPDAEVLLGALGRLWLAGVDVDWDAFHAGARRRRVALPTYPFERQRYWVDPRPGSTAVGLPSTAPAGKKGDIADWFYRPTWTSSGPMQEPRDPRDPRDDGAVWMVFVDECGLGRRFVQRLDRAGCRVISVEAGERFERRRPGEYAIRPSEAVDYDALFRELRAEGALPDRVVHAWGVTRRNEPAPAIDRTQDLGFYSLVFLAQALGNGDLPGEVGITVVTSGMQGVSGEGLASPEKATVLGPCRVIPQEYAALGCRSVDIVVPESGAWRDDEIDRLLAESGDRTAEPVVAYRGGERWVQTFEAFRLEGRGQGARLRERGVYLITGGLGGIGLALATFLAESVQAKLVLVGRNGLPPREEWGARLQRDGEADATSRRIRKLEAIEALGAEVLVLQADVSDRRQMEEAIACAEARFGRIHGVIHSAGVAPGGVIQLKTREMAERVLAPKVQGTLVLEALLEDRHPDFVVLCSSLASVLGVPGQADYCAANAFQDAFARRSADAGGPFVVSLNWDTWMEAGMAVEGDAPRDIRERQEARLDGILSAEGAEVFARALRQPLPQLLVSTVELGPRLALFRALNETLPVAAAREPRPRHRRPELATAHVAPRDEVEQIVAELWQELLGFELVGVHDNFFDLGGHSLLATQITNWLRQTFQVPLKLQTLFDGPTVAGLARAIVENEPRPGQAREIARLALSVEGLSNAEVERMLEETKSAEGYAR